MGVSPGKIDVQRSNWVHLTTQSNVFVERLWRTVKYENVYLHGYETMGDVRIGLTDYFEFYNSRRPHDGLKRKTPDQAYFGSKTIGVAA